MVRWDELLLQDPFWRDQFLCHTAKAGKEEKLPGHFLNFIKFSSYLFVVEAYYTFQDKYYIWEIFQKASSVDRIMWRLEFRVKWEYRWSLTKTFSWSDFTNRRFFWRMKREGICQVLKSLKFIFTWISLSIYVDESHNPLLHKKHLIRGIRVAPKYGSMW